MNAPRAFLGARFSPTATTPLFKSRNRWYVLFTGIVRGITQLEENKLKTVHLVYEAYAPKAEQKLEQITVEIRQRFPKVKWFSLVQRIGRLEIGDIAVAVACASGHCTDGIFSVAEDAINRLKEIVPVWKKEIGSAGEIWFEGSYYPTPADDHSSRR